MQIYKRVVAIKLTLSIALVPILPVVAAAQTIRPLPQSITRVASTRSYKPQSGAGPNVTAKAARVAQRQLLRQAQKVKSDDVRAVANRLRSDFPKTKNRPGSLERAISSALKRGWTPTERVVHRTIPAASRRPTGGLVLASFRPTAQDWTTVSEGDFTITDWDSGDSDTWAATVAFTNPSTQEYILFNVESVADNDGAVAVWDDTIDSSSPLPEEDWIIAAASHNSGTGAFKEAIPGRLLLVNAVANMPPVPCYVTPMLYTANYYSLSIQRAAGRIGNFFVQTLVGGTAEALGGYAALAAFKGWAQALTIFFTFESALVAFGGMAVTFYIIAAESDIWPTQYDALLYYGCSPGQRIVWVY